MRTQPRRRLGQLAAALVSTLFALLAVEAGLRHFWRPDIEVSGVLRRSADPALVYELVPGSSGEEGHVPVTINSAGFRGEEFREPGPGGLRILALGDSVAFGWGVPLESAFPVVLERKLRESGSDPFASSVVYNLAVHGYSTRQEIRLLETRGLALDPDLVIITYVLNDPDADGGYVPYFDTASRIEVLDLAKRGIRFLWERVDGAPEEYHHKMHARYRDEVTGLFRRLGEISREHHFPILVLLCPAFRFDPPYPFHDLHDFVRGLCESNGIHYLDLYPAFEGRDLKECALDVWHPTAEGHAVMADTVYEYLRTLPPSR